MHDLPKPNTQAVSWFLGEYQKRALRLDPKYQRKKVWSKPQQCFLIDSLISKCPIPQVYLNIVDRGTGAKRKTIYEVVDGQQRLTTIIEFLLDKWALEDVNRKAYPISSVYLSCIGKFYSELPTALQNSLWSYPLAVQELRDWSESEIQALFRRLNIVNVGLTKQELRHSQYFGKFITTAEKLADDDLWADIALFSPSDYRRMKDIEFVSELLIIVIDGLQDQQKSIDEYYEKYDVEFLGRTAHLAEFRKAILLLSTIRAFLRGSRFSKRADLYGLFAAVIELIRERPKISTLAPMVSALQSLDKRISDLKTGDRDALSYHRSVIEGANKLKKREVRLNIILRALKSPK